MKTTITIENGRIEIQVDDGKPVLVQSAIPAKPVTSTPQHTSNPAPPPASQPGVEHDKPTGEYNPEKCGYCRKRGSACARHGGKPSPSFKGTGRTDRQRVFNGGTPPAEPARPQKPAATKLDPAFKDPWNCQMCRNAQDLCVMHEQMTNQGKRPPGVFLP